MIADALALPFFQRILLAGLLAAVTAGIIGSYVVIKKMTSVTGGLAHAAFGGVGLGYFLGFDPLLGAAGFGLLSGLGIGVSYRRLRSSLDTSISMVWSGGMAIGIVFVAITPGYAPDLTGYLFGSILFSSWDYVILVALLDLFVLGAAIVLHRALESICFDEEFSEVMGLPVDRLLLLLLAMISLSVVTLIRVVGVILAIALLTLPAATARQWTKTLRGMMVVSVIIAATVTTTGLFAAYGLSSRYGISIPSGPIIVLLAMTLWGASPLLRKLLGRPVTT